MDDPQTLAADAPVSRRDLPLAGIMPPGTAAPVPADELVLTHEVQPMIAGLDIGHAVLLMKAGHALARAGWNGKGMFVYHVEANAYPAQSPVAKRAFGPTSMVPYRSYLAMKTVDGEVVPWVASQTDLLAQDWQTVEGLPDAH